MVCGKSFDTIREEITFNFLTTNPPGRRDNAYLRRRNAFQAGMLAGSFTFFHRGVLQAATCDGNYYEMAPNNSHSFPMQLGDSLPLGQTDRRSFDTTNYVRTEKLFQLFRILIQQILLFYV